MKWFESSPWKLFDKFTMRSQFDIPILLRIHLEPIWSDFPMVYLEPICHLLNKRIQEVSLPITNRNFWAIKPWDDVLVCECGGLYNRVCLSPIWSNNRWRPQYKPYILRNGGGPLQHNQFPTSQKQLEIRRHEVAFLCGGHSSHTFDKRHIASHNYMQF
jgi:hypothetical protein